MTDYFDSLTAAVQHAQDWDLPMHLLPNVIVREAERIAGCEAGHSAHYSWPQ